MFLPETRPELRQGSIERLIIKLDQPSAPEYHNVQSREVCLMPESFPNPAFYPIALDREFEIFLGKHQSDPGTPQGVGCCQDQKIPVRNPDLNVIEDFAVIAGFQQPG